MPYRRRILRYGPSPDNLLSTVEDRAIAGCTFDLHRLGGCGRGEVRLRDAFPDRRGIAVGEFVALEYDDGERWYLGQVEERRAESPGGVVLQLEGLSVQLNHVFPGGFGRNRDGAAPHRYALTDRFAEDPDYSGETVDVVERPEEVVRLLMSQYVIPTTDIRAEAGLIEDAAGTPELESLKFNGEESARSILKDLALRCRGASWGVDELGRFFLLQSRAGVLGAYREGVDLLELREEESRDALYNRVLLTGGYIYGSPRIDSEVTAAVRWRGHYRQPDSIARYGERRIRLWVPWIRTSADSRQFVREFFRLYAVPTAIYTAQVVGATTCPRPWAGGIELRDRQGHLLVRGQPETIRVRFDNTPRLTITVGPEDPRTHWPEPPFDDRFPLLRHPASSSGGNSRDVSLTGWPPVSDGDGGGGDGTATTTTDTTDSSAATDSSENSSFGSTSLLSSDATSTLTSDLTSMAVDSTLVSSDGTSVSFVLSTAVTSAERSSSDEASDLISSGVSSGVTSSDITSDLTSTGVTSSDGFSSERTSSELTSSAATSTSADDTSSDDDEPTSSPGSTSESDDASTLSSGESATSSETLSSDSVSESASDMTSQASETSDTADASSTSGLATSSGGSSSSLPQTSNSTSSHGSFFTSSADSHSSGASDPSSDSGSGVTGSGTTSHPLSSGSYGNSTWFNSTGTWTSTDLTSSDIPDSDGTTVYP